ncbi:MAG: hypothetical protein CVU59_05755 [Deltaproteobacteria bacterium HGW-Deltaproteobacteria-17]|nr:MAG: hypothetical protein CVU59_05755 [Deltaproteobacteria bacterium HGW-Deltaproteobacteria-17]
MRRVSILCILLPLTLTVFSCDRGSDLRIDPERCDNQLDDDLDGHVDCEDQDCWDDDACDVTPVEQCDNLADDDDDGFIDCDDLDCADVCEYREDCGNEADDDDDGFIDCEDQDCWTSQWCDDPQVEDCANGVDDDGDDLIDCDDPDCSQPPNCVSWEYDCADGLDDEGDGLIDCEDPDCDLDPACGPDVETCDNGVDDDGDGDVDCADDDCGEDPACVPDPERCDNGVDDDGDGDVDCADADCELDPNCIITAPELCANAVDDDGDGDVDCADADCAVERDCLDYDGVLGAACRVAADCSAVTGGQCLTELDDGLPGGACTRACSAMNPCPNGASCVTGSDGSGLCARTCASASDCRSGYQCTMPAGATVNVCNPRCGRDWQCRDTRYCNTGDGLCVAQELCLTPGDDDGDGQINCADTACDGDAACGCVEDDRGNVQWTTAFGLDLAAGTPLEGSICGPTYQDWFVFTPAATISVTITASFSNAAGDLDLYLYDAGNLLTSIAMAYTTSDNEVITRTLNAGTTYYLLVDGYHRAANTYTLTITQ